METISLFSLISFRVIFLVIIDSSLILIREDRIWNTFFSTAFLYLLLSLTSLPSSNSKPATTKSVLPETAVVTFNSRDGIKRRRGEEGRQKWRAKEQKNKRKKEQKEWEKEQKKQSTKERKNKRKKEQKKERTKEQKNERTKEQKNRRTKEQKNKRTKEQKNKRTEEQKNKRINN